MTSGSLRLLNRDELAGVIVHELAHVKNRDTLIMTVAATLAGALSMLAKMALWRSILGGSWVRAWHAYSARIVHAGTNCAPAEYGPSTCVDGLR